MPSCWPSADVAALEDCGRRCRELAATIAGLGERLDRVRADHIGVGEFRDRLDARLRTLGVSTVDGLPAVAARLRAMATAVDDYARLAADTEWEMTAVAALADREIRRGEVMAALGDDSARVLAASTGRLALTAAGEEFADRAETAGAVDSQPPSSYPGAGNGAMMSMGALGGGMVGVADGASGRGVTSSSEDVTERRAKLDGEELWWLRRRAEQVRAGVDAGIVGWLRTAVGIGWTPTGRRVVVVATNDPQPYQRRGMVLADDEALTADGGPPELAIIAHLAADGVTPRAVASADEMASGIVAALRARDVEVVAPNVG
ncbi:hypothetical protein QSJ18_05755 [Gordonia sp. ABSL1-1]|uniref:hypothetical protein n=1 Tax=Gordonia sp. ABSL1-1 TaxID=3053923 RepID=UPI0025741C20|nr:hypothetical protein [Gordonia sp. ABSL1-1]MDL9936241.1 hypothetical protein [Gordonia sp. ABSL1-1]